MSCYLYIPLVGCWKNRYQNGSFIHTPNEVHSTNISMWAFNSYGNNISTQFHYHIFKTARNMKHTKQLGNQYPSWTSTRHILGFFLHTSHWAMDTQLEQSTCSMSCCKLSEGLVERKEDKAGILSTCIIWRSTFTAKSLKWGSLLTLIFCHCRCVELIAW